MRENTARYLKRRPITMRELKIGTAWVRGVVGDAMTPELVANFACAFGTWVDGGPVVIVRDTRQSSIMFRSAVLSGLLRPGCEVIDLGVCSTPLLSFAVRELGAAGGIAVSGSHNDINWNALKFLGPDGALLNSVKSEELLDLYHASTFSTSDAGRLNLDEDISDLRERYLEHLVAALDQKSIQMRSLRIAVDFCNGATLSAMSRLLEMLGCELVTLNPEPTGEFAHSPAPNIVNMAGLADLVKKAEVDLGAALNVDGDRIAFVTAEGTPLSEEYTLPLASRSRLARRPGSIATSLSTSRRVDSVAQRFNSNVLRTEVGESFVVDRGLSEEAVLAGEGSGGVAGLPVTMTYDAFFTLGMILESLARSDETLEDQAAEIPRFDIRKGELRCLPAQAYNILDEFRKVYADENPDLTDGVRVDWKDAWLHVRVSNTEPVIRIIAEADSPERSEVVFQQAMRRAQERLEKVGS